jgi:predicted Zn-dependent peptidase
MDVIGSIDSVTSISRDRIYDYYKTWYRPGNMTALVMGDFERDSIVALYERFFGASEGGAADQTPVGPILEEGRLLIHKAKGPAKTIWATVRAIHPRDPQYFDLEAGASVLSSAGSRTIEKALAVYGCADFSLEPGFNREHAWLTARLKVDAGADHGRVVAALFDRLRNLSALDFPEEVLREFVIAEESSEAFNMERLHFYGMLKAPVLAVLPRERLGDFVGGGYIARLKSVEPAAAAAAVARCFAATALDEGPPALVSVFEPSAQGGPGRAAIIPGMREGAWEEVELDGRRVARFELENGLVAVVEESAGSDVFAAHVLFRDRTFNEPAGKEGITDFLHRILPLGAAGLSGDELESAFAKIGARVKYHDIGFISHDDYYTTPRFSYIRLQALERYAADGMSLLADVIEQPAITAENVARARRTMSHLARQSGEKVSLRARKEFLEKLFPGSFLAGSVVGTVESIESVTLDDLVAHHRSYFSPGNMIVTVVSSLPVRSSAAIIGREFGGMAPGPALERPPASIEPKYKNVIETVVEGEQNHVIYGFAFHYDGARKDMLDVAVDLFSSAVTFKWRETEGGAYGMGASYAHYGDTGWFWTRIGTTHEPEDALQAVRACIAEFRRNGVTAADVSRSVNSLAGWRLMKLMTREGRAYRLAMKELQGHAIGDIGIAPNPPPPEEIALPVPMD